MFYSQLLLSKKGPLGTIWIAAHCHKRLKKEQVQQTNITSSVDKILLDEAPVVTYRILGHLLLGVVRIYSKKVEYLFHDCNNVLVKLGDFSTRKRPTSKLSALRIEGMRAPTRFITRPKRFELDTFDLEVLEDQDASSGHVASREEIMLSDARENEQPGFGLSSKYEEHVSHSESLTTDHTPVRDILSPHLMYKDFDVRPSPGSGHVAAMLDLHETRFSLEERFEPMTFGDIEIQMTSDKIADHLSDDEQMKKSNAGTLVNEEHLFEKRSSLEEHTEPMIIVNAETETNIHQMTSDKTDDHQNNDEQMNESNAGNLVNEEHLYEKKSFSEEHAEPIIITDTETETNIDQGSEKIHQPIERLKHPDIGVNVDDEGSAGLRESFLVEKHFGFEKKKASSSRNEKDRTKDDRSVSLCIDVTPEIKFPGSTSPDFISVRTPATKERTRISRKRKCIFDESIVIRNEVFKHWIGDASDLVCKRRKAPHSNYLAWKAHKISSLPQSFEEPLIPWSGASIDITSAICKIRSTRDGVAETVEVPLHADIPESPNKLRSGEQIPIAPATSLHEDILESPGTLRCGEQIRIPPATSLHAGIPESPSTLRYDGEQTPIAPATPVTGSSSLRFHDMGGTSRSHIVPASSTENSEKGARSVEDIEFDMNLMDEEINSCEGDTSEKCKFSLRTRKVARFLLESFLARKGREEVEAVNFSLLLKGKTKRDSARVFYEILVLKSGGWIDVRQDDAYKDIHLQKLPRLKHTFEAEGFRSKS
ncbi:sister chromatid cohesion 1 protein 2 [Lycium ferocissimum]|uniref:sister chromatid cohesion 1 protein 2 n=1 Tax=Lycium ferocissimum TaxID=112874 RepID=UPI00281675B3|nr:sister chromatid cohesion 1 protein 2 [Lycium ferocissimum]